MSTGGQPWTILIHGGAKTIAPDEEDANLEGLDEAVRAGAEVLAAGGSAVAAVEAAIRVMEVRPVFNAGKGSVAALPLVAHPVSVAREVLGEREILLAGNGALAFARERGADMQHAGQPPPVHAVARAETACDTVGAVARDRHGDFAAGTSTGGLEGTLAGRVGDSPMPGCGFYADNEVGAVALSGDGEEIARLALGLRIIDKLARMDVRQAIECSLTRIARLGGEAGAIALDRSGHPGFAHNSSHFAVALMRAGREEPEIWLKCDEKDPA